MLNPWLRDSVLIWLVPQWRFLKAINISLTTWVGTTHAAAPGTVAAPLKTRLAVFFFMIFYSILEIICTIQKPIFERRANQIAYCGIEFEFRSHLNGIFRKWSMKVRSPGWALSMRWHLTRSVRLWKRGWLISLLSHFFIGFWSFFWV